jgi:hypothetical protein
MKFFSEHENMLIYHGSHLHDWQDGGWDDSTQTPEEIQAKILGKQEAALKRERALAYAFSHQVRSYMVP